MQPAEGSPQNFTVCTNPADATPSSNPGITSDGKCFAAATLRAATPTALAASIQACASCCPPDEIRLRVSQYEAAIAAAPAAWPDGQDCWFLGSPATAAPSGV